MLVTSPRSTIDSVENSNALQALPPVSRPIAATIASLLTAVLPGAHRESEPPSYSDSHSVALSECCLPPIVVEQVGASQVTPPTSASSQPKQGVAFDALECMLLGDEMSALDWKHVDRATVVKFAEQIEKFYTINLPLHGSPGNSEVRLNALELWHILCVRADSKERTALVTTGVRWLERRDPSPEVRDSLVMRLGLLAELFNASPLKSQISEALKAAREVESDPSVNAQIDDALLMKIGHPRLSGYRQPDSALIRMRIEMRDEAQAPSLVTELAPSISAIISPLNTLQENGRAELDDLAEELGASAEYIDAVFTFAYPPQVFGALGETRPLNKRANRFDMLRFDLALTHLDPIAFTSSIPTPGRDIPPQDLAALRQHLAARVAETILRHRPTVESDWLYAYSLLYRLGECGVAGVRAEVKPELMKFVRVYKVQNPHQRELYWPLHRLELQLEQDKRIAGW